MAAAVAITGTTIAVAAVTSPFALEPEGSGDTTNRARGAVRIETGWALTDVTVRGDGRDVSASMRRRSGALALAERLADGRHTAWISARRAGPVGGRVKRGWSFDIDTSRPPLHARATRRVIRGGRIGVAGRTEPRAKVTAQVAGRTPARTVAGRSGRYRVTLPVGEGTSLVRLTATDAAGNSKTAERRVVRDATSPRLRLAGLRPVLRSPSVRLRGRVVGEDDALVTVRIDGAALPSVEASEGRFALVTPAMAEGTHTMAVTATDAAGNSGTAKQKVLVDSTERFGMATLGPGARGADARRLATLLRRFGGYRGRPASAVEPRIAAALRRFQRRRRLEPDGLAGPDVRAALLARLPPRIKIDLSGFRLTLYRGGILARSYPVAVGQDRYPTPRGSFRVIKKETNPAWDPPDAPWAAELDTIPPGPGNPLGTRWIGTSRGAIGIHGTYAEGSIGTRASHGCIRMRIADVEELFEEIELGTPIGISA